MWHTPDGDRVLTVGEWALARAGLGLAWDAVEIADEARTGDAHHPERPDGRRRGARPRRRRPGVAGNT